MSVLTSPVVVIKGWWAHPTIWRLCEWIHSQLHVELGLLFPISVLKAELFFYICYKRPLNPTPMASCNKFSFLLGQCNPHAPEHGALAKLECSQVNWRNLCNLPFKKGDCHWILPQSHDICFIKYHKPQNQVTHSLLAQDQLETWVIALCRWSTQRTF